MQKHIIHLFFIVVLLFSSLGPMGSSQAMALGSNIQGLSVDIEYAKGNDNIWAVIWLNIAEEYYTYAPTEVQDDSILPVVLSITNAEGMSFSVRYPLGVERRDFYDSSKIIQSYDGKTPLFVDMGKVKSGDEYKGKLSLLLCSKSHCLPVNLQISLNIPSSIPSLQKQDYFELWQKSVVREQSVPPSVGVNNLEPQDLQSNAQEANNLSYNWKFSPRVFAVELEVSSLEKALFFGFLAGIILNLMPCVFPVLTLKASSFLAARQGMKGRDLADFRMQNLLFACGMLSLFLMLALFLGSAGLIWGQFYQNSIFVAIMVVFMFLLALSMFGLFSLPVIDLKSSSVKSPKTQAYLTGMVTTLLATPCSGPLLGGVLSWAFTQPLPILVLVFVAVGLGMSTPYLLLALKPEWAKILPRPGAWMHVIERLVAFFLLATALYLFSILPQDIHMPMLIGLIVIAFCGWLWGHFGGLSAPRLRRNLLGLGFVACIALVIFYATKPPTAEAHWHKFEAASFKEDYRKIPMLVEFTADWCPNCKFVEKTVLTADFLDDIQEKYGVKLVRVDITRNNPQGEALLHALGSSSIPLTAIFTKGLKASKPIVLRDIYTQDMLEEALEEAF